MARRASLEEECSDTTDRSSFSHDPADPVPTYGGNNLPDSIGGTIPCGPLDQSPADLREDVLTFQTQVRPPSPTSVLAAVLTFHIQVFDSELALTGPLMAVLFVSSDAGELSRVYFYPGTVTT